MTGACQVCGGGGATLPSLVKVTCIPKQYQVSGQSGIGFLARDWDGECDGVLPNASIFRAILATWWCEGVVLSLDINSRLLIIDVTQSGGH